MRQASGQSSGQPSIPVSPVAVTVAQAVAAANRVPLFAELWEQDPAAIVVGETVLDYLVWLRHRARAEGLGFLSAALLDSREFFPASGRTVLVVSKRALKLDEGA